MTSKRAVQCELRRLELWGVRLRASSFLFMSTTLLLLSCANPKYVTLGGSGAVTQSATTTCQAKFSSGDCVGMNWQVRPNQTTYGSFTFKTFRPNLADGSPIPETLPGTVAVVLWMPSMGHGSVPVTVTQLDVGTYSASNVFFTMQGDWQIIIQLKSANAVQDQAIIPITF